MKQELINRLAEEISRHTTLSVEQVCALIEKPKNRDFGDLAFPCFPLAKELKLSPALAAEQLETKLSLPSGIAECIKKGPFLNFRIDRKSFSCQALPQILAGTKLKENAERVIVEYSSPNIAKPFHVGHLRATLIGNCLDRVYRALGWETISVNHLGDWGTQFGFVWAGCKLWGAPEQASVASLVELYRKATGLKAEQESEQPSEEAKNFPDVNKLAREYFIDLEEGKEYAREFWQECVDVSLEYLRATYQRLGVSFDHYTGESFYSDKLADVEADLAASELLKESEGALGVDLGEKLGFARIATPDGRSLYLTRDLATAKYRAETFNFDRAIYVVGAPQTLHFQQLIEILRRLNTTYAEKLIHVAFGHVMGMKTRGGGSFIELNEFLDEAYERALHAYNTQVTKRPEGLDEKEVARKVALAAILFSNLSRTNIKDVHFSWDSALEFQGDSGPYLLYAYARINGIREKALEAGITLNHNADYSLLTEDSAFELLLTLTEFPEALAKTAKENEPSVLANYCLALSKTLSKAYLDLKVIGLDDPALAEARLMLFEATAGVLKTSIELLGIQTLERM